LSVFFDVLKLLYYLIKLFLRESEFRKDHDSYTRATFLKFKFTKRIYSPFGYDKDLSWRQSTFEICID